ncbi:hypothetical protein FRB91_003416 [Serendipita sp. 411]|nr:hypothetical protein FRB91_003416 [Serendipita sp. 411]
MWGKVSGVLSPRTEHPRMKFSTGLIGLALALNVHAAPKPSSSTAAKSTSTKPPATTSASPLVSSSTQQATTTTCRPPSVAQYSQCGGMGYTGSTTCTAGGTCVYVNELRAHQEVPRRQARQLARRRPVPPLLLYLQRPPHVSHLQSCYGANAVDKVTPVLVLALREVNAFMSTNGTPNACIASSRPARAASVRPNTTQTARLTTVTIP